MAYSMTFPRPSHTLLGLKLHFFALQVICRCIGTIVLAGHRRPRKPVSMREKCNGVVDSAQETACMLRQRYGMDSHLVQDTPVPPHFVYANDPTIDNIPKSDSDNIDTKLFKETMYIKSQWRYMALVLDRFFFTIYFILILVSLGTLFPWPNENHKIAETNV